VRTVASPRIAIRWSLDLSLEGFDPCFIDTVSLNKRIDLFAGSLQDIVPCWTARRAEAQRPYTVPWIG